MASANNMQMPDGQHTRRRTFYVPNPPSIALWSGHWANDAWRWTVRPNRDRTGFDNYPYPYDPSGFNLGPPSQIPDYHPLLEKWGLQVLEAAGFINHQGIPPSDNINGRLAFAFWRNPSGDETRRIHPVLTSDMWPSATPEQYALMKPALHLATAILDDPVTLNYFHALAMPASQMTTQVFNLPSGPEFCRTMKIPVTPLTQQEQERVFRNLVAMRSWTSWGFETGNVNGRYGVTEMLKDPAGVFIPASKPNTRCTRIRINETFLTILARHESDDTTEYTRIFNDTFVMAGIPFSNAPISSPDSAYHRTILMLATTILHEFVHAFTNAFFEHIQGSTAPREPWAPGDRCNEAGLAFENYMFGGPVNSIEIIHPPMSSEFEFEQSFTAPFGLYTFEQWDRWDENGSGNHHVKENVVPPHLRRLKGPQRVYPVPQAWTDFLFSDEAWGPQGQVRRFGLDVLTVPKDNRWAVTWFDGWGKGRWKTGEERWGDGGPPTQLNWI